MHNNGSTTRTTTLTYGNTQWRDLLTAINLNGTNTTINYDGNTGNPTNWHSGWSFTWARGRQLQTATRPGVSIAFAYDVNGIRTGMTVTEGNTRTEHSFYTQGGRVVGEVRVRRNATTNAVLGTDRLEFIYDESGRPLQMILNGVVYNYVLNLQGDVQQIRRASDGVVVATYLYNAWGELLSMSGTRAAINPLRYRGKLWDTALGMYYLNSRFYDPVVGRFINWDGLVSTGQGALGYNMFAYCLNNPVNMIDPTGYVGFSPSGVECWDTLNQQMIRTGGPGNTTGWQGSTQQRAAQDRWEAQQGSILEPIIPFAEYLKKHGLTRAVAALATFRRYRVNPFARNASSVARGFYRGVVPALGAAFTVAYHLERGESFSGAMSWTLVDVGFAGIGAAAFSWAGPPGKIFGGYLGIRLADTIRNNPPQCVACCLGWPYKW